MAEEAVKMTNFFRFPHTPHLAWLGVGMPRDDKVLSTEEAADLLSESVVVEEKIDGANLGISIAPDGSLRVQNRGQYLIPPFLGQFSRLSAWSAPQQEYFKHALGKNLILFGEWCAARHSLDYQKLPDWLLVFDVYDREAGFFWSTSRRDRLATKLGLASVPRLFKGHATTTQLKSMVEAHSSIFRKGPLEGIVIRKESRDRLESRAKLVRANFTQAITEHWSRARLSWNHIERPSNQV